MENLTLQQLITQTKEALTLAGASNYYQKVFKTLTNQLLLYAEEHNPPLLFRITHVSGDRKGSECSIQSEALCAGKHGKSG